ncbi:hypothetical protein PoB_000134200 [Plakobranchus ocellatus]|uniref:THAP-type domain-containing protein n=1 Tax=Plakobranchus ocellatus TaxID=259542 RepID=A0AAV3XWL6_9GAST|nr:hypothetical protein PoB_000134200 [Plakobranchus ocellatus]
MNSPVSVILIMYCGSVSRHVFPPYFVYKAEHLWPTWTEGGPPPARYNRSKSRWFDNFRATGLHHSFDPSKVLNKLPPCKNEPGTADTSSAAVSDAVPDVLSTMRRGMGRRKGEPTPKKRCEKINVILGKNVSFCPILIAFNHSYTHL